MKRDNGGQLGWTEAFMAPGLGINATLQKIDEFVKWQRFAKLLNRVRPGTSGSSALSGDEDVQSRCCCSNGTGCRTRDWRKR